MTKDRLIEKLSTDSPKVGKAVFYQLVSLKEIASDLDLKMEDGTLNYYYSFDPSSLIGNNDISEEMIDELKENGWMYDKNDEKIKLYI